MAESEAESEPQAIETPASYTFLPAQLQILQENVETVKAQENVKARHKAIKAIRKQVLALPESKDLSVEDKADLATAVNSWFSVRTKKGRSTVKFVKVWTGRLVMYQENKQRVNELKSELYEKAKRQGKEPSNAFNYFQRAITKLWEAESEEEQVRYGNMAKRWNKEGVSREQKQEGAMKHTMTATKKFAEEMYRSFGVRYLFMVALETPSESVQTGVLDFNDSIAGGTSYTTGHGNWKTEGIDLDSWNEHNRDYYNPEKPTGEVDARKLPRAHLSLKRNEYGEPIVPNPLLVPRRQNARAWRQNVVRAFLSIHYELASGSKKPIPWKKFVPRARECVGAEYLPAAHLETLAEPSSMRDNQCHTLLTFWYERQSAGNSPVFRFEKYLVQDEMVDANPRELVEGLEDEDEDEAPPPPTNQKGKKRKPKAKAKRKRSQVKSAKGKGKKKADLPDALSSDDSGDEPLIPELSDHTGTEDEDEDPVDDFGLDTLYDTSLSTTKIGPPTAGSSTQASKTPTRPLARMRTRRALSTDAESDGPRAAGLPMHSSRTRSQPAVSDEDIEMPLDIESLQPALQEIAKSRPKLSLLVTPVRPAADQDSDEEFIETPLDLSLLQPELQAIAKSIPSNTSTVRPVATKDGDEEFIETPLDLSLLQPELQAIAKSITSNTSAVRPVAKKDEFIEAPLNLSSLQPELHKFIPPNTSPAVQQLLLKAFQALHVETKSPSNSTAHVKNGAVPMPRPEDTPDTKKRSRSESVGTSPSSPTKKSRPLEPDSISSNRTLPVSGPAMFPTPAATPPIGIKSLSLIHQKSAPSLRGLDPKALDPTMGRGKRNTSPNKTRGPIRPLTDSPSAPEGSMKRSRSPMKKNYAEVVIPSRSLRRSRSQAVLSKKMGTRANPSPL